MYHIDSLVKKLNSICYGIRIVNKYMNEEAPRIQYFANFQSLLAYGIIFWGGDSRIQNVFVVQKRIIRIIKRMNYLESCRSVFRKMGIMTVYAVYIFECLMFFVKHKELFEIECKHEYNTRSIDVKYPIHRLTLTERFPHYMCIKLFNVLPDNLKRIGEQKLFKRKLKKFLIELEPYSLSDFCENL